MDTLNTAQRKALIIATGYTFKDIADVIGVSRSAVTQTIQNKIGSKKIRHSLAVVAGVPYEEMWPGNEEETIENCPSSGRTAGVVGGSSDTVPEGGRLNQDN